MCKSVNGNSWEGYKLIFDESSLDADGYSLDSTPVLLSSIGYIPVVSGIYNYNATVEVIGISPNIDKEKAKTSGYLTEYYECVDVFPAYDKCLVMYVNSDKAGFNGSGIYKPSGTLSDKGYYDIYVREDSEYILCEDKTVETVVLKDKTGNTMNFYP